MPLIDKTKIIEAIKQTDDEWVLLAINRLLQIEEEVPQWHREELDRRTRIKKEDGLGTYDWEAVKDDVNKIE